jgi:hypothetical protein
VIIIKEVLKYQCEICHELYDDKEEALECEYKGIEEPIAKVGEWYACVIGHLEGNLDNPMYNPYRIREINRDGHYALYIFEEEYDDGNFYETLFSAYGNKHFLEECFHTEEPDYS